MESNKWNNITGLLLYKTNKYLFIGMINPFTGRTFTIKVNVNTVPEGALEELKPLHLVSIVLSSASKKDKIKVQLVVPGEEVEMFDQYKDMPINNRIQVFNNNLFFRTIFSLEHYGYNHKDYIKVISRNSRGFIIEILKPLPEKVLHMKEDL